MKGGVIGCLTGLYLIAAIFFAIAWFGVPFIGDGGNHGLNVMFSRDLVITKGKIIRFEDMSTPSHPAAAPVVEIPNGKYPFRFRGGGSNSLPFDIGDEVSVAYPAGHPELAYIRTFSQMYMLPLLFLLFGLPFFALAVWGTATNWPKRDTPPSS
jgi:hypothetical protein